MNETWAEDIDGRVVQITAPYALTSAVKIVRADTGKPIENVLDFLVSHPLVNVFAVPVSTVNARLEACVQLYHLYPDGTLHYTETAVCPVIMGSWDEQ